MRSSDSVTNAWIRVHPRRGSKDRNGGNSRPVLALMHEMLSGLAVQVLGVGLLRAFDRLGGPRAGILGAGRHVRLHRVGRAGRIVRRSGVKSKGAARDEAAKRRGA